jgi:hypothetical protein
VGIKLFKKKKEKLPDTGGNYQTPVTLATQEAEIRRIVVPSQPWADSL